MRSPDWPAYTRPAPVAARSVTTSSTASTAGGLYRVQVASVRWKDGDTNYVYYSLDIPLVTDADDDVGGGEAGLVISKDGRLVERVACQERPYMFISYLRVGG